MRSRTIIELVVSAAGIGMLVLRYANQISNSLQFISLPEELKGALIAMSKIPTLLAWAIFFIGLGALGFLIYDTKPVALAGMGSRFRKTLVQPLQLIILGLVIAAIGAAWQLMRSAPTAISQTDNEKRITSLVKELDAAKRTVANYEARDQAKASADALVSLAKNWPESAADRELRGMAALHTTESAPKPSTARFKPQYEPEEISQMLTALRNMRGIIEKNANI